ncbi:MAG: RNA polymerase sigma factor [Opitutales bacterium]|nr:RNA polymerase sigma factor [Opitutales bacterium]
MNDNETDIFLMRRIAKGDDVAVRDIVLRWQKPLINFFYRSLNDVHTAEDLTQETFIKLCQSATKYVPTAAFSSYLFQIAHNILVSNYRNSNNKFEILVAPQDLPEIEDERENPAFLKNEIETLLAKHIKDLPDNQRTALLLFSQQHFSYEAIAETMKISIPNVKTLIHRARLVLRKKIQKYF